MGSMGSGNAGHVTTSSLIAGGFLLLLENPEQLARLRQNLALVPNAVEEMLRLISPVSVVLCRARSDGLDLRQQLV